MRTTFNPAQADLFGARDLHLSAMPVPETEEVSRLQNQVRHLRGELQAMVDTLRLVNDSLAKERARVASYQAEVRELTAEVTGLDGLAGMLKAVDLVVRSREDEERACALRTFLLKDFQAPP